MSRNIKYQFRNLIERNFQEGMDKHSMKKMKKMDGIRIFSYADRKNLLDLSSEFSNYMKEQYNEVKMIKNINTNHIQEFLIQKSKTCSQKTLEQYASRFRKLERMANSFYHANVDFHSIIVPISHINGGGKLRDRMITNEEYEAMLRTNNENLRKALLLAKEFGLRASECSKLRYKDLSPHGISIIDSKGKRSRFVPIENTQQSIIINSLIVNKEGNVCPIQSESLQQAFRRELKKQGISIKHGAFHALRKNYATHKYQEYREQGLSIQDALDKVSDRLGHGACRNELMKAYICCDLK